MIKTVFKGILFSCLLTLIACQPNNNTSDLIQAINNRQTESALQIINSDIKFDVPDSLGLSPIHWASKRALPCVTRALIKKGCDINAVNCEGYTALNYAIRANNQESIELLLKNGAVVYKNGLSNLKDGPFVDRTEDGLYAYYLKHDSIESKTYLTGKYLEQSSSSFKGWAGDTTNYSIRKSKTPKWQVETQEPVFVVGDIHGQFDRLISW